ARRAGLVSGRLLLLAGDRLRRALAGPRVGVGPLAAHRQALAVPQPAVAAEIHQALDAHRRLAAEVTLNHQVGVDDLAKARQLVLGEFVNPPLRRDPDVAADPAGRRAADSVNVGQSDHDALLRRDVHARNARHTVSPRALPEPPHA